MNLREQMLDDAFDHLPGAVTATSVTPTGDAPIADVPALWLGPVTEDAPGGMELRRREVRSIICFKRSDVPTLPQGSIIVAPELVGADDRTWRVEGPDYVTADQRRVVVVPEPD